eukprot:CAMPEP_0174991000 /NCGR_PEP_ID=MMETSP0004_2-20121128/21630_1 /TAXON_ID=420556 /ORGANISM="Ochromonas sp., Strain CCMP1393" /LENGTH=245 /DNA_ID=CAMNT_0016244663 /DNA_START=138 /DNA_END=875 /DNA_ORIENTATION=-
MPEVLETISIESPVRQTARYIITVENPLPADIPVSMGSAAKPEDWWSCDSEYVKLNEQKATPPLLKQVLRFDAPLGSMQSESFIFHAYNTVNSNYACAVKKPEYFTVQSALVVAPVAGCEYLCELIGNCTAPMPQGPYLLAQGGGGVEIPFRNCFSTSSTWSFSVDSPAFRVSAPTGVATVNAKTQSQCSVVFEPKEEHMNTAGGIITAKLFVTCTSIPNIPPWVFYLKGEIDPNAGAAPAGKKK